MQDHDDRRGPDGREVRGRGWQGEDDDTQEAHGYRGEGRSWEPPYGDERTYGRQGQRGGSRLTHREGAEGSLYPRGGGGSYGRREETPTPRRPPARDDDRYGASGQGGQGGFDASHDRVGGGRGSGYGGAYRQDHPSADRYQEGVYGEGAGRGPGQGRQDEAIGRGDTRVAGVQAYGGGDRADTYDADFDPHYVEWRRSQLAAYDRDYQVWRESQVRTHDEDYRRWRDERRRKFHEDFHGWRQGRADGASQSSPSAAGSAAAAPEADKDSGRGED